MEVFVKMEGVKDGEVIGDTLLLGEYESRFRSGANESGRSELTT